MLCLIGYKKDGKFFRLHRPLAFVILISEMIMRETRIIVIILSKFALHDLPFCETTAVRIARSLSI